MKLIAKLPRWGILLDLSIIALFVLIAAIPWETCFSGQLNLSQMLSPPSLHHPFGTDNMGRDLLVQIAAALKQSVLPLWLGVIGATTGGVFCGFWSLLAQTQRYLASAVLTFKILCLIIASIPLGILAFAGAAFSEKAGLWPVTLSLALVFFIRAYLLVWDLYRHDQKLGYWIAHESLGGSLEQRIWRYGVLGSWWPRLLDSLSFNLRAAVAMEASLSYLGFGIQEPQPSFGNMLASHFDLYLKGHGYVLAIIAAAMAITAAFPKALQTFCQKIAPTFLLKPSPFSKIDP